jgi:hypothetical protein
MRRSAVHMNSGLILRAASVMLAALTVCAQDARDIVRKSVDLDQANWLRMKDYTWIATSKVRQLDGNGKVKSEKTNRWETLVLYGEPFRRNLEKDGKPLSADEQRKQQEKLDEKSARLARETPDQIAARQAKLDRERQKERDFLREIPDMYDFQIEREDRVEGHDVWVISASPKTGYKPRHSDAKPLLKIKGRLWIDKAEYQWVRLEAETFDTISFGLFLARLYPGTKLFFEQTRVNDEVWLPKRELVRASARLGLVKKLSMEEEVTWSNFRKFQADSKVVAVE